MEHASTPPWRLDLEESVYTQREPVNPCFFKYIWSAARGWEAFKG